MIRWFGLGLCFLFFTTSHAQEPSNAYRLTWLTHENKTEIAQIDLLTGFNKNGYNNQPAMQGDRLYLSSSWNDGSSESTDIIALDLQSQKLKKITQTSDQEFRSEERRVGKDTRYERP